MMIDPRLAHTLATVMDEGTLDAASRRLHLTPSAVSQRVKLLEEQVGQRLITRTKPVRATDAGRAVIDYARRLALLEGDLAAELGSHSTERVRLPVAVNADSLETWFGGALDRLSALDDVELEIHREDQDRTVDLLEAGTVLAAVTDRAEPVAGCRSTPLGVMTFAAVATPPWCERWLGSDVERSVAFTRAPRIDYDRSDGLQRRWLAALDVSPAHAPRHLLPSVQGITEAVLNGLGWAMLPLEQADVLVAQGDLILLGGPTVSTTLHWQRWKGASARLDALSDAVHAAASASLRSIDHT